MIGGGVSGSEQPRELKPDGEGQRDSNSGGEKALGWGGKHWDRNSRRRLAQRGGEGGLGPEQRQPPGPRAVAGVGVEKASWREQLRGGRGPAGSGTGGGCAAEGRPGNGCPQGDGGTEAMRGWRGRARCPGREELVLSANCVVWAQT